jgi:hypothetical protein
MDERKNTPADHMKFFEGASATPSELSPEVEAYRQKWIARDRQALRWLDAMSEKNPVRIAGELLYARIQDVTNERLGRMLRTSNPSSKLQAMRDARGVSSRGQDKAADRERAIGSSSSERERVR